MNCPRCHNKKERKDFYWRGDWLAYKECKYCVKEIRDEKKRQKESNGIFEPKNWLKLIIG